MRILIAHNRYRRYGGEERHVDLLAGALAAAGHDVLRYEPSSGDVPGSLRARLAVGAGVAYRPSAGRKVARLLAESPREIAHFHNIFPLLTPAALRAAKQHGSRVVLTVHNFRFACPAGTLLHRGVVDDGCIEGAPLACALHNPLGSWPQSLAYGIGLELQRRLGLIGRWVDAFVAPSRFVARMLVRAGLPERRVAVIPHGVPLDRARNGHDGRFALYAGRLSHEKGIATLLEAAERARVPLVVAGDGPEAPAVRAAANGLVRFIDSVPAQRLVELRREAAFVVVPSECPETLSLSALEALAAGRPVVATRVGALPEVVSDGVNGVVVPPGDAAALAAAMRAVWENDDRRDELGEAAYSTAQERFSLEQQTQQIVELYERLLRC